MEKVLSFKNYDKLLFSKKDYAFKKYGKALSLNYFDNKDFIIELQVEGFVKIDLEKFKQVVKEYYKKCREIEV